MPLYEYECTICGTRFESMHQTGASAPACPIGHEAVRRCFCPPAIVFRGSGFYATDNRKGQPAAKKPA